jgi:hypothetical protein
LKEIEAIEHLPSKCEALSSNASTAKKKKKTRNIEEQRVSN